MKFVHITTAHALKRIRRMGIRSSATGRIHREVPAGGYVFCMPLLMLPMFRFDDDAEGGRVDLGTIPSSKHWPRILRPGAGVKGTSDLRHMVALVFSPGADNWPALFSMPSLYDSARSDLLDSASRLSGVEQNRDNPRRPLEFRVDHSKALGLLIQRFFDAHGGIDRWEWDFEVRLPGPVRPNRIHRTVPLHKSKRRDRRDKRIDHHEHDA